MKLIERKANIKTLAAAAIAAVFVLGGLGVYAMAIPAGYFTTTTHNSTTCIKDDRTGLCVINSTTTTTITGTPTTVTETSTATDTVNQTLTSTTTATSTQTLVLQGWPFYDVYSDAPGGGLIGTCWIHAQIDLYEATHPNVPVGASTDFDCHGTPGYATP